MKYLRNKLAQFKQWILSIVSVRICLEFYNTLRTQFELLPRLTIIYGKGNTYEDYEISKNGIALEWMWFGVFLYAR